MKKIIFYGDERLREHALPVEDIDHNINRLVKSMRSVLKKSNGIGLAAPQIGVSKRVFLAVEPETEDIIVAINPEIIMLTDKGDELDFEGCLSFPEVFFSIKRIKEVAMRAYNEKGKEFLIEASGILARCFQHEADHLDGKLIIDYASDIEKKTCHEKIKNLSGVADE